MNYEMVIGLEVHAELLTRTKIFCSCKTDFASPPNTQICPICLGYPGALPSLNRRAVELAIRAGLATGCQIARRTYLDRKNYFYPDLPKAYQISQDEHPLCYGGRLGGVGIKRIHIEEDAGKLIHDGAHSLIDHNRCGMPLIEIVSEPFAGTPEDAVEYLKALREILRYAGVSDCKMQEGSMRCDVNVSLRERGTGTLGTRCEIKNINSFAFVADALRYEYKRQAKLLDGGERVSQQTRRYDERTATTVLMRVKETADDYRYFPEPDLIPIAIEDGDVEDIRRSLPTLPGVRRRKYEEEYALGAETASVLTSEREYADFFDGCVARGASPRYAATLIVGELLRYVGEDRRFPISQPAVASIANLCERGVISYAIAKQVCDAARLEGIDPEQYVTERGLSQISDEGEIERMLRGAMRENPRPLESYRTGKAQAIGAYVGAVMKKSGGRANAALVQKILKEIMGEMKHE